MSQRRTSSLILVGLSLLLGAVGAQAQAVLTPQAQAAGFGLSTFLSGIPNNGAAGVLGIVNTSGGRVLTANYVTGELRSFSDVDNQSWTNGTPATSFYGINNAAGLGTVGGNYYLAAQGAGLVLQIDSGGNFLGTVGSAAVATGLAGNEATGNLFVSSILGIVDLDPRTGSTRIFAPTIADGLSVNTAGTALYAADELSQHIVGFDIATGTQIFDSGFIPGGIDGTALGAGTLAGNIFVNTNGGTLWQINLQTSEALEIFSAGSRGDFVSVDPNGSLLLTQTDSVLRLTAPGGGGFGVVPLPAAGWLLLSGIGGLGALRRKPVSGS